jgi:hypothetical protein
MSTEAEEASKVLATEQEFWNGTSFARGGVFGNMHMRVLWLFERHLKGHIRTTG